MTGRVDLTEAERAELIEDAIPYARALAYRFCWEMQINDRDEVISDALYSLVTLAREWDPNVGLDLGYTPDFKAFVGGRLRRRLIDHYRTRVGRKGNRSEARRTLIFYALPFSWLVAGQDSDGPDVLRLQDVLEDQAAADSFGQVEALDAIRRQMDRLSPQERKVVELRLQGLTLAECGEAMGFTESRASQLGLSARAKMRRAVA